MAFELWHPFATAMERAVLLRDLRENGVMPAQVGLLPLAVAVKAGVQLLYTSCCAAA